MIFITAQNNPLQRRVIQKSRFEERSESIQALLTTPKGKERSDRVLLVLVRQLILGEDPHTEIQKLCPKLFLSPALK